MQSKNTFSHASYASFRPSYPPALYNKILKYHNGPPTLAVDLGCGHGLIARSLSPTFTKVIATDPSEGMVKQATTMSPKSDYPNIELKQASAESLPFLKDASVDMVTAGQAAHWFDHEKVFAELARVVRPGGTLAYFGYKDHVFVDSPIASKLMQEYAYSTDPSKLGSYWQQPGRSIIQNLLRSVEPPSSDWTSIQRHEYEPGTSGKESGEGEMLMNMHCSVGNCKEYIRTWSSYHGWRESHKGVEARNKGGEGDVVDELFDEIAKEEGRFGDEEEMVNIEWGSVILLARRK